MKITKERLQRIIKEEINRVLREQSETPEPGQVWLMPSDDVDGMKPNMGTVALVLRQGQNPGELYYNVHSLEGERGLAVQKEIQMGKVPEGGMGYGPMNAEHIQANGRRVV